MATVQNKSLSISQLHLFPFFDIRQQEFDAPFQSRDSLEMVRMLKAQIYFFAVFEPKWHAVGKKKSSTLWLIFSFMGKHVERNKSTPLALPWGRVCAHSQKCRLRAANSPSVSNINESFSLLLLWVRHRRINQFQAGMATSGCGRIFFTLERFLVHLHAFWIVWWTFMKAETD